jgi:hypothetical protein
MPLYDLTDGQRLLLAELDSIIENAITQIHGLLWDDPSERQRAAKLVRNWIEQKYFPTPRQRMEWADSRLLTMYEAAHKVLGLSVAEFARRAAEFNRASVPRPLQRGASGTDVKALDHHLRELLRNRGQAE